jgi:Arc/MetJ-type ribon-helix-helix transcriptional regulator
MATDKKTDTQTSDIWVSIEKQLKEKGIDLDKCFQEGNQDQVKVVCIAPDLGESYAELSKSVRGETVMIRIDEETNNSLDTWVETGYFKSRSEAAALFLKEGLKIRASELVKLKDSIDQLKKAKEKLRNEAKNIFGRGE